MLDVQWQTRFQNELLKAYDAGDLAKADMAVRTIRTQIGEEAETARFHLPLLHRVADGAPPLPEANLVLHQYYLTGLGVEANQQEALNRLMRAVDQGSERAEWFLASYLLDNKLLSTVLPRDPGRALPILRRLAQSDRDITAGQLAQRTFSSYIARNLHIDDVSPEDLTLVQQHADDRRNVMDGDLLPLALFFADAQNSADYSSPAYSRSRELLIRGKDSRSEKVRAACEQQLEAWNVNPVPEPDPTPAEQAIESIKVAGMLGGVTLVMIFWSMVGLFLLSVAALINAFIVPILLGGLLIVFLVSKLRG